MYKRQLEMYFKIKDGISIDKIIYEDTETKKSITGQSTIIVSKLFCGGSNESATNFTYVNKPSNQALLAILIKAYQTKEIFFPQISSSHEGVEALLCAQALYGINISRPDERFSNPNNGNCEINELLRMKYCRKKKIAKIFKGKLLEKTKVKVFVMGEELDELALKTFTDRFIAQIRNQYNQKRVKHQETVYA